MQHKLPRRGPRTWHKIRMKLSRHAGRARSRIANRSRLHPMKRSAKKCPNHRKSQSPRENCGQG
jgi:hypothetical protein